MFKLLRSRTHRGNLAATLLRLHRDEQGAQGLEVLLIVAAIILPLLGVLILFRDKLKDWVAEVWNSTKGDAEIDMPDVD